MQCWELLNVSGFKRKMVLHREWDLLISYGASLVRSYRTSVGYVFVRHSGKQMLARDLTSSNLLVLRQEGCRNARQNALSSAQSRNAPGTRQLACFQWVLFVLGPLSPSSSRIIFGACEDMCLWRVDSPKFSHLLDLNTLLLGIYDCLQTPAPSVWIWSVWLFLPRRQLWLWCDSATLGRCSKIFLLVHSK